VPCTSEVQYRHFDLLQFTADFFFFWVGWDWVHLLRRPLFGLLYQSRMIDDAECGAVGGMRIDRGNRSTRGKPAPAPLGPPQTPRGLTWGWTLQAEVGRQRLTAWAMARPLRRSNSEHWQQKAIFGTSSCKICPLKIPRQKRTGTWRMKYFYITIKPLLGLREVNLMNIKTGRNPWRYFCNNDILNQSACFTWTDHFVLVSSSISYYSNSTVNFECGRTICSVRVNTLSKWRNLIALSSCTVTHTKVKNFLKTEVPTQLGNVFTYTTSLFPEFHKNQLE
jgi:hypothetical protein